MSQCHGRPEGSSRGAQGEGRARARRGEEGQGRGHGRGKGRGRGRVRCGVEEEGKCHSCVSRS